jgi:OmcA/MtrC family decaheme c-type cytochrome
VTNTAPGQRPTVQFRITESSGAVVSPATFGSNLNLLMGGPTTDYDRQPFREQASGATFNGDTATYTFTNPIPANAVGTWTFSIECRRTVVLNPAPSPEEAEFTEGAVNDIFYAAVTDPAPVPRRAIVDLANCNTCHDRLTFHGGQRLQAAECVLCHNPNADDSRYRTEQIGGLPAESIDFKRMIHRIHTGEDLTRDFTIIGRNGAVHDFNEIRYPGDRRDCTSCHVNDAWNVPEVTQAGRLPTITMRDWYTPQQPNSAACLGCHDSQSAAAHAFVNTAPFGEACAACHGVNAEFAVEKVHAR